MKKILTFALILISFQINAQIGYYYQNVQKNYATVITESNSTSISTKENDLLCGYWFSDTGICIRIVMQWENETYDDLIHMLNYNEDLTYVESQSAWYNYVIGEDNNNYLIKSTVELDSDNKPYINIELKQKVK